MRDADVLPEGTGAARATSEMADSESRLRALLELTPDGIFKADASGRYVDVNDAGCRMLGYSREELLGKTLFDLLLLPPEERSPDLGRIVDELPVVAERTLRGKDGRRVRVEISGSRLPDGSLQGIVRDVTLRERAEEALRQTQKLDAIGRLAAGVAHDFNNLLTVILAITGMLLDKSPDPVTAREMLREVRDAGNRGAELTRQLLAFVRQQSGAEPHVADAAGLVARFAQLLRRVIGEDVQLVLELTPDCFVLLEPQQLEQILMNLCINARDAMPSGGRLKISCSKDVSARTVGITVSDQGIGMSPEVISHLFEPLFTTKPEGRGTGLGLATVLAIVKRGNGTIDVDSAPDRGTTIRVTLPLATPVSQASAEDPAAFVMTGTETVLLVEDEEAVREVARRILVDAGYRVHVADSPARALDMGGAIASADLLVTDVVMPGMSGATLGKAIRSTRPDLPLLFISGYATDASLGALGGIVQKPFTSSTLLRAVRAALTPAKGA